MTTDNSPSTKTRKQERAHTWGQIVYSLRVLVLLVALGVVIWVYGGDAYVVGVLLICALGVFAAGIAPGLVPEMVRWVVMMPFVLGALIPLWRLVDALLRWEQDPILRAAGVLGGYAIAALLLIRLPTRMREPFVRWLPKGAIPSAEAEAIRRRMKDREDAARQAERERAEREKQAARAKADRGKKAAESDGGGKKRFGFGRGKKAAEQDAKPAGKAAPPKKAAAAGTTNPFYAASGSKADPEPESGGRKRFSFGRGKKAAEQDARPAGKAAPPKQAPPKKAAPAASPFYDPYDEEELEEDAFSGGGRYDWDSRYDPPGMGRRANPFYAADDEDEDDDDDAAGGFSWSSADPGPGDAPEDDLMEKIREMRRKQKNL